MDQTPLEQGLASLSRFFVGSATMEETLHHVAALTVDAVEPADVVGLTLVVEGQKRTAVYTDPASPEIDQAQYDTGRGPCLECFVSQQTIEVASTAEDDERWPEFCRAAREHGIGSTLSQPLIVDGAALGAMNLYARDEHAFHDEDREAADLFATQAAIVVANAHAYWDARQLSNRLGNAMASRAVIEQAKGILMGAQRCSADEAFELLVRASQRENVKVRDIAARIVAGASGEVPRSAPPGSDRDER